MADSSVHGRGVFASRRFEYGDDVESCPVLPVPGDQVGALDSTDLYGFVFEWEDGVAFALGYGSLYNHSWTPNARYDHDYERRVIVFSAVRPIEPGDEITINYSGEPDGRIDLWFDIDETTNATHNETQEEQSCC
ncbi:MAG TPA: SET domain-containing protein [Acidimicrobiales bacterium]